MKLAQSRTLRPSKIPFSMAAHAPVTFVGFVDYRDERSGLNAIWPILGG
jgi:hypothetical protein